MFRRSTSVAATTGWGVDLRIPQGSFTDEPIFWADLLAKGGHTEVGVLVEQSLVGESYVKNFRKAAQRKGIRVVAEARLAQTAQDVGDAIRTVYDAKASALVHCGFGFGILSSILPWQSLIGTHRDSPAPRFRTPGSIRCCGRPSWGGPVSTKTTRQTPWGSSSSTGTKRHTGAVRNTACPWSTAMSPPRCCTLSPTPTR